MIFNHRVPALTIFLFMIAVAAPARAQVPAFAGAEGSGAYSVGGRGGQIVEVTSLDDHGPGTLREALLTEGPRTIVFRVGGTIELEEAISVSGQQYAYVTVAGQTAPGGGILVSGSRCSESMIQFHDTHDIVIRYLRGRKGFNANQRDQTGDPFVFNDVFNVMVDHCSVSWTTDQNMSVWSHGQPAHNISFQWNLFAEPLSSHPTSLIVGSNTNPGGMLDIDVHHNLFITPGHRLPNIKAKRSRVVNNLAYNWGWRAIQFSGGVTADVIGNVTIKGPATGAQSVITEILWRMGGDGASGGPVGDPSFYVVGNMGHTNSDPDADNWAMVAECEGWMPTGNPMNPQYRRAAPLDGGEYPISVIPAGDLEGILSDTCGAYRRLDATGAWVSARDAVDLRLIGELHDRSAGLLPDTEADAGGFPTLTAGTPYPDSDHDGMSDIWETAHGLDPSLGADGLWDADGDGYTNVEEFLNGTGDPAVNLPPTVAPTGVPLTGPAPLEVHFAAHANDEDGQITAYAWEFMDGQGASEADPAHTFAEAGDYEVNVAVTDDSGATATASLSIIVSDTPQGDDGGEDVGLETDGALEDDIALNEDVASGDDVPLEDDMALDNDVAAEADVPLEDDADLDNDAATEDFDTAIGDTGGEDSAPSAVIGEASCGCQMQRRTVPLTWPSLILLLLLSVGETRRRRRSG